jgi:hypothetical protein
MMLRRKKRKNARMYFNTFWGGKQGERRERGQGAPYGCQPGFRIRRENNGLGSVKSSIERNTVFETGNVTRYISPGSKVF